MKVKNINRKKGWKKIDTSAVEEVVSERLGEERIGLLAERSNEDLFYQDNDSDALSKSKKLSRREKFNRTLRCHANLVDNLTKPVVRATKPLKKKLGLFAKQPLPKPSKITARAKVTPLTSAKLDIWGATTTKSTDGLKKKSLLDEKEAQEIERMHLRYSNKHRVNLPSGYRAKPSQLPAVEVPRPGASYNPTYNSYQQLKLTAHYVEVQKEKVENRVKRQLDEKFPLKSAAPTEETYIEEMSAGLFDVADSPPAPISSVLGQDISSAPVNDDESEEQYDSESIGLFGNAPVTTENRKTKKQRRKEKERKIKERELRRAKLKKKLDHEYHSVKKYAKEVKKTLLENEKKRKEAEKRKATESKIKTRRLSKLKFEPNEIEVKLEDEMVGSLRLTKPEGDLFVDRIKSLQRRNIIEPRVRAKKCKAKVKNYIKNSHRIDESLLLK